MPPAFRVKAHIFKYLQKTREIKVKMAQKSVQNTRKVADFGHFGYRQMAWLGHDFAVLRTTHFRRFQGSESLNFLHIIFKTPFPFAPEIVKTV